MPKKLKTRSTLYSRDLERRPSRKALQARAAIAERFKSLCSMAGLKVPQVARTLHVTERTVYAWFSGATAVPYSAYKLLRILGGFELPGGWSGWRMHSGKLWTPEGFGFEPADGVWWAGVCRRARLFHELYRQNGDLARQLANVVASGAQLERGVVSRVYERGGAQSPSSRAVDEGEGRSSAVASAASGLVTVSTSGLEVAEAAHSDTTVDTNLTSHGTPATRYHFDYGMTSCPIPFDSQRNLTKRRESAASDSASASMHSSRSPSMSTFIEPVARPVPLWWPFPRMHLGWRQSVASAGV